MKKKKIELICACGRVNAAKGKQCTCEKKVEESEIHKQIQCSDEIMLAKTSQVLCFPEKVSYTSNECKVMTPDTILSEFEKITGYTKLRCKHCGPRSQFLSDGFYSIRERWSLRVLNWCRKHGIQKNMKVPETCDIQKKKNDLSNPINNEFNTKVKKCSTQVEREELDAIRVDRLLALGISARPKTAEYWKKYSN